MPLPETVETYKYLITEAEKIGLAYIVLVRYSPAFDLELGGRCFVLHQSEQKFTSILSKANYEQSSMMF